MTQSATRVVAGLIFRDGRLLIATRPEGKALAGFWEFPGGKVEPGESDADALGRELMEELGVVAPILSILESVTHEYERGTVEIAFYQCRWESGDPFPHDGQRLHWIRHDELDDYEFPPADERLLNRLRDEPEWWAVSGLMS